MLDVLFLRSLGVYYSLDIVYGGQGISKSQFLIKKETFFSCMFLSIFGYQTLDPDSLET
jgi:hypothetical protein